MKQKASSVLASACTLVGICLATASAATVTFEGLLGTPNTFDNNAAPDAAFTTGGASFPNSYTNAGTYDFWSGFAISNTTDVTTPGYGNQYSAITGIGAGGSSTYAVSYNNTAVKFATTLDMTGLGTSITNTTFAALSMRDGDGNQGPGKKFGGPLGPSGTLGTDPDFFRLTISGFASGIATGVPVDFYLADFRFVDNSQDYIVNQWTFVDFSALGTVDEIRFSYTSSDTGRFGINTPTYFAVDNFPTIPEPSSAVLVMLGSLGLLLHRRK